MYTKVVFISGALFCLRPANKYRKGLPLPPIAYCPPYVTAIHKGQMKIFLVEIDQKGYLDHTGLKERVIWFDSFMEILNGTGYFPDNMAHKAYYLLIMRY